MTIRIVHIMLRGTCSSCSSQANGDAKNNNKMEEAHDHLLNYHLSPLHRPSSMVLWRDQTSLLELYHEPLVQCTAILLQKKPEWIAKVIAALLEPEIWNKGGNTPKLVLLLH